MRPSDHEYSFYKAPYEGGKYVLSLRDPWHWYNKRIVLKGKRESQTYIDTLLRLLVDKTFGQEIDQEEVDLCLNLDCMVSTEAAFVQAELEKKILAEVLARFPQIGAELPEDFYRYIGMDLVIYVPKDYEDQRGYFF